MRFGWRAALGIALSAGLLWWVVKDQDLVRVGAALAGSNLFLWAACTGFATLIFPLRARRWQALLAPTYGRLPLGALWRSTAVGMMVNNVAPLRAGEFARAFAVTRALPQVKFTAAFASLAVDRLFDGTIVLLLMLAATLDPLFPSGQLIGGTPLESYLRPVALFLSVVLAGALMLLFVPGHCARDRRGGRNVYAAPRAEGARTCRRLRGWPARATQSRADGRSPALDCAPLALQRVRLLAWLHGTRDRRTIQRRIDGPGADCHRRRRPERTRILRRIRVRRQGRARDVRRAVGQGRRLGA